MISQRYLNRNTDVKTLTAELASADPVIRQNARASLVALRTRQVSAALIAKLTDPRDQVRWEAAKALASIADPVSAPALVDALDDENPDVCWVASEGLIALGKRGMLTVLNALTKRASSATFCEGASRVLHAGARFGENAKILAPVLKALSDWEPGATVPLAAHEALKALVLGTGRSPR